MVSAYSTLCKIFFLNYLRESNRCSVLVLNFLQAKEKQKLKTFEPFDSIGVFTRQRHGKPSALCLDA